MARAIKFRAWSKKYNTYFELSGLHYESGKIDGVFAISGILAGIPNVIFLEPEDIVLEQYTGLKDKNGKEICEGDMVRWVDDYDENAYIGFDEGCFWVNWPINSERINGEMADDVEIIGNIHENPELLEGEK